MRLELEQIKKLCREKNTDRLWSHSRISKYETSKWEYYLNYILHEEGKAEPSAYAPIGSLSHSILEDLYERRIKYDDMYDKFVDGWFESMEVLQVKFDRNNVDKNETIKNKYEINMRHFFKNHTVIPFNIKIEQFVTIDLGNNEYMQGYIDATYKDDKGCFHVVDFKTSSMYRGSDFENKSKQLILYGVALMQRGVPREKIIPEFNFLKYVTCEYQDARGNWKSRTLDRCYIGKDLTSNVSMHLKKLGYDKDEIKEFVDYMVLNNTIEKLPKEMKDKLVLKDCYAPVDFSQARIDEVLQETRDIISEIRGKEKEYFETKNEKLWWDNDESLKKNDYYYTTLCEYSIPQLKPFANYLDRLNSEKQGVSFGFGNDRDDSNNDIIGDLLGANKSSNAEDDWLADL